MWRARLRMCPTVSSAAEMMFDVGALTTMTPASVADLMSTLSSPTPARAMTFSCGARFGVDLRRRADQDGAGIRERGEQGNAIRAIHRLHVEVGPEGFDGSG